MAFSSAEIFGRKIFFMATDSSLIPESFVEDFCARGYETRVVNDTRDGRMRDKVRAIAECFPDSMILFNVDSQVSGIDWRALMVEARGGFASEAVLGALYLDRENDAKNREIESHFKGAVDGRAGCLRLSKDRERNFSVLMELFDGIHAKGRRNHIRANCDKDSMVTFELDGQSHRAKIEDVNISHFRCALQTDMRSAKIYTKIRDAKICVNGLRFTSDCVLIMKREREGVFTAIFMFIHDRNEDLPDLDESLAPALNKKICQIVSESAGDLLRKALADMRKA